MTGTTREARSDTTRARVADEATKVAVPVIVRARPIDHERLFRWPPPLGATEKGLSEFPKRPVRRLTPRSPQP